jgi:hypothetical protein
MEARATLRGPKVSRTLVAGVLVVAALGVGAVGGYVAAGLGGGKAASPSHAAAITKTIPVQGHAVLPDWIVQETTPKSAPAQRILQDDIIRNARPVGVPDWIAQEFPPMTDGTLAAAPAQALAACPAGTHIAVWYAAGTTSCVADAVSKRDRFIA